MSRRLFGNAYCAPVPQPCVKEANRSARLEPRDHSPRRTSRRRAGGGLGLEASAVPFHELVAQLGREYDRMRLRVGELCAENAMLRAKLSRSRSKATCTQDDDMEQQRSNVPALRRGGSKGLEMPGSDHWLPLSTLYEDRFPSKGSSLKSRSSKSICAPPWPQELTAPAAEQEPGSTVDTKQPELTGRPSITSSDGAFDGIEDSELELEISQIWLKMPRSSTRRPSLHSEMSGSLQNVQRRRAKLPEVGGICLNRLVMRPSSRTALVWDLLTIMILLCDFIAVPLQVFQLNEQRAWDSIELAATVIWTIDLILSFFKGFEVCGEVELHPRAVMLHYLQTWFAFDISIVSIDWVLLVSKNGNEVDWLRFGRFRRALRLLRLARLVKHGSRLLSAINYIRSEDWLIVFRVCTMLILLIAINHFIACGWYGIGTLGYFDEEWTAKAFDPELHGFAYKYTTSFHWSVTQFTPASMEVVPQNPLERAYNIFAIFFGLLMFSSFVSNMTNSMTYLTKRNYEKRQQRDILLGYMSIRDLTLELKTDIINYLSTARQTTFRAMKESEVTALRNLPETLLERLHVEVHSAVLGCHALFSHLQNVELVLVQRFCHQAMAERSLVVGEDLFRCGVHCNHMYFMVSGEATYSLGWGDEDVAPCDVHRPHWLSEACLWVEWEHRGRLTATTLCEVTELDAIEFQTIMSRSRFFNLLQKYAQLWAEAAQREAGGAEFISDLWGQRLRVMALTQKAFRQDSDELEIDYPESRVVFAWFGGELARAFMAWRSWTQKEKHMREQGFFSTLRRWLPGLHQAASVDRKTIKSPARPFRAGTLEEDELWPVAPSKSRGG